MYIWQRTTEQPILQYKTIHFFSLDLTRLFNDHSEPRVRRTNFMVFKEVLFEGGGQQIVVGSL